MMEAKAEDTVMSIDKRLLMTVDLIAQRSHREGLLRVLTKHLEAQAEVSFKAGQDSVFDSMPENLPPLLEAAHKAGIREVVEWIEQHSHEAFLTGYVPKGEMWQAKLEEWGVFYNDRKPVY